MQGIADPSQIEMLHGFRRERVACWYGLTLIEVLVVMAIVSLLAALALPAVQRARSRSLMVKTQATIAALETALSMYESDFGDYPPWSGGGSALLVDLLQGPVASEDWRGPYMRFRIHDLDPDRNVLDPWGRPLEYRYPQTEHPNTPFLIRSSGPDRQMGTHDDIGNW